MVLTRRVKLNGIWSEPHQVDEVDAMLAGVEVLRLKAFDAVPSEYTFRRCSHCTSVNQTPPTTPLAGWICEFCRQRNAEPKGTAASVPVVTALQRHEELQRRGMLVVADQAVLVGGFRVLGGSGLTLPVGAVV